MQDHAIKLILGDHNFRSRLQNFLDHYPDIRKRMPDARVLDLRLDDRITVVEEARNAP
jgi:cell division protein FtsQ